MGSNLLERLGHDVRFSARFLYRNAAFTAVVLFTLGLGIGMNTAIFSVVHAVLLRPLPYENPSRLVMLEENMPPRFQHFELSPLDYRNWEEQNQVFSDVGAFVARGFNLTGSGTASRISGARISASVSHLLGIQPILGRSFSKDEEQLGRDQVVLLGEGVWKNYFGSNPQIINSVIKLDSKNYTVIGIMPAGFHFPDQADLWVPLAFTPEELSDRSDHFVWGVAQLKPGVTLSQAQMSMDMVARGLAAQFPNTNKGWGANVFPLADHYVGKIRVELLVLLAAVGFVLIIACANIANLLLARASARQKEISLRAALGASRKRIIQQLLTESVLLGLAGGVLGLIIGAIAIHVVVRMATGSIPRASDISLDYATLFFTLAISVVSSVLFGLTPAIRLSKPNLLGTLRSGEKGGSSDAGSRMRNAVLVAEVAIALVLVVGAGLLVKSFWRVIHVQPGFDADNVLTMRVVLPKAEFANPDQQRGFLEQVLARVRSLPAVQSVAATSAIPLSPVEDRGIYIEGRSQNTPEAGTGANYYAVTPDYFNTMKISLIRGRLFSDDDRDGKTPVAIINQTIANRFFPDQNPVGKRLDIGGPSYMREIVGVVGNVKQASVETEDTPQVYESFSQKPQGGFILTIRTSGDPAQLAGPVRRQINEVNNELPVFAVRPLQEIFANSLLQRRFALELLGFFAALAVFLAAIGIYGVVSYAVARRTREIGIRLALGAQRGDILGLILKQGVGLILAGFAFGIIGVFGLSKFLTSLLYGIQPTDPATLGLVILALMCVALGSCYIPARRAMHVDPIISLRYE